MLVKNDGVSFREEDWQRLKRIAEGNPDETKIGAFGVGFYSVFSECEEPFVSSGSEAMAFYWKGNQLFTRRGRLPKHDPFTTFLLEYRTPTEPPPLAALCQFLATSLTFVSLEHIDLYIDKHCLASISKKSSPSSPLSLPSNISTSQGGRGAMIKIVGVSTENVQIDAKIMGVVTFKEKLNTSSVVETVGGGLRGFWSHFRNNQNVPSVGHITPNNGTPTPGDNAGHDLLDTTVSTIFIRIATAQLQSNVPTNFAHELERATKKPPPKRTKLAILTMSKDEIDASDTSSAALDTYIFANILPTKLGKIFIGFPTHQTTGIKAHVSAHSVIPTVERESIDFNARWVRDWNAEMLRMAGILSRICYWHEMDGLRTRLLPRSSSDKISWEDVLPQASHMMDIFTFSESTPSPVVGQIVEEAFWQCSSAMQVLSTKGVLESTQVRILPPDAQEMGDFLDGIAFLPKVIMDAGPGFVKNLRNFNLITDITMSDVKRQLEDRALTGKQMVVFLKWLAKKKVANQIDNNLMRQFLNVAIAISANTEDKESSESSVPIPLQHIQFFVNVQKLSPDLPLPPDCIPFSLTRTLKREELFALGWTELDLVTWLKYITAPATLRTIDVTQNIALSSQFAGTVFGVLSRNWDTISKDGQDKIITALKSLTCVPTTKGMKVPGEAYFHTVKLFRDLPLISPMHGVKDKFLVALGVRKTLELRLVLERLSLKTSGDESSWSHVDLIKYFTSVRADIPAEDIELLRQTPFCKCDIDEKTLYKISDLFIPKFDLKELGCPILDWPGGPQGWKNGVTSEEKLLIFLGLKKFPGIEWLLNEMIPARAKSSEAREKALRYFIANHQINGYHGTDLASATRAAFIPLERRGRDNEERFGSPLSCYTNTKAEIWGFDTIRKDLRIHAAKFGVSEDPPLDLCIERLLTTPPTTSDATAKFGYFASRLLDFNLNQVDRLSKSSIVPIMRNGRLRYLTPRSCFIGGQESQYKDMFDFVDFGSDSNAFLMKIGCKLEPTLSEIAYMLTKDAERLLASCQSASKYLSVLRTVAEGYTELKKDRTLLKAMRKASFLLATVEKSNPATKDYQDDDNMEEEERSIKEYQLASAEQIVVVDDFILFNIFMGDVLACPQEEILETFYTGLGSVGLSKQVEVEWTIGRKLSSPERSAKLRELVLERCRLFFHNNNSTIKRDAKWLDSNLQVQIVESIKLRRTLSPQSKSHVEKSTAAVMEDAKHNYAILNVTKDYSTFDVANQLMKLLLLRPKPHSALLLESLMNTSKSYLPSRYKVTTNQ